MTGDGISRRVAGDGVPDYPGEIYQADLFGQALVTICRTKRQGLARLPDLGLKVGTMQMQSRPTGFPRKGGRIGAECDYLCHNRAGADRVFKYAGINPFEPELLQCGLVVVIHEIQEADATAGQWEQTFTNPGGVKSIYNFHANTFLSSPGVIASHWTSRSCRRYGSENPVAKAEDRSKMRESSTLILSLGEELQETLGAAVYPRREQSLKRIFPQAKMVGHFE
jgi:hypothetical protein